ncbi:hypothetical protein ACVWWO_007333 [Bradyrhizobium sp. F1.13.1]
MFEGIRTRWAEARADVASGEVDDILQRYERRLGHAVSETRRATTPLMDPLNRRLVVSAFQSMMSELVEQFGPLAGLQGNQKKDVAKQVMAAAKRAFSERGGGLWAETSKVSAHGAALLSLYLELQTLRGDRAVAVVANNRQMGGRRRCGVGISHCGARVTDRREH